MKSQIKNALYEEMCQHKILSQSEQIRLITLAQNGDIDARNKLIEHNLKLIIKFTRPFLRISNSLSFDDLFSIGVSGLMHAIKKFDAKMDKTFSTYAAIWIKHYIQRYLEENFGIIRISVHMNYVISKIEKIKSDYFIQNGEMPTEEYLIDTYNKRTKGSKLKSDTLKTALIYSESITSLNINVVDANISDGQDTELLEFIIDTQSQTIEDEIESKLNYQLINDILNGKIDDINLNEREFFILKQRIGFEDDKPKSLKEIANVLGISPETVRKIQNKALCKIKNSDILKEYFPEYYEEEKKLSKK